MPDPSTPDSSAPDPETQAALRRQVEQTLKFMRVQTAVVFVILLILIVVLSGIRGVMILVTIVFLLTSAVAYTVLARTLNRRVLGYRPPSS
jgi:ABC-type xylose transport system permease subunit